MFRVGAVSTSTTHLAAFAEHLTDDVRMVRALALPGEPHDVPAGVELFTDWDEFLDGLDGVMLLARDGRLHLEQFGRVPELPVFVDKPLACTVAAASELLASGRVFSCSMLRWLPEVQALGQGRMPITRIQTPADPRSPYAGRWFMGLHGAELATQLLGDPEIQNVCHEGENLTVTVSHALGETALLLHASRPEFIIETEMLKLPLNGHASYAHGLKQVQAFFQTGQAPLTPQQMLAPVRLLESILGAASQELG